MELNDLTTISGLSAAIVFVTGAVKQVVKVSGRMTHLTAFVVAAFLTAMTVSLGGFGQPPDLVKACATMLLAWLTAIGAHQATVGVK